MRLPCRKYKRPNLSQWRLKMRILTNPKRNFPVFLEKDFSLFCPILLSLRPQCIRPPNINCWFFCYWIDFIIMEIMLKCFRCCKIIWMNIPNWPSKISSWLLEAWAWSILIMTAALTVSNPPSLNYWRSSNHWIFKKSNNSMGWV